MEQTITLSIARQPTGPARACEFRAEPGLEPHVDEGGTAWHANGDHAGFVLQADKPGEALPAGWYELRLNVACLEGTITLPSLRLTFAAGAPTDRVDLGLPDPDRDGNIRALVLLKFPVVGLRLRPGVWAARFRLSSGALRRVPRHLALRRMLGTPQLTGSAWRRGGRYTLDLARFGLSEATYRAFAAYLATLRPPGLSDYELWVRQYDTFTPSRLAAMRHHVDALADEGPRFAMLMVAGDADAGLVARAIDAVRRQAWPHWELHVLADPASAPVVDTVRRAGTTEPRIRVTATGADVAQVFNAALNDVTQNHVVVLDATCILRRHALLEAARAFHADPALQWLYSDEDRIDANDRRSTPYFKPDWNPELLASGNYIGAFAVFRAASLRRAGGLRAGFADRWHALYLRCADCIPGAAIGHIPAILWHAMVAAPDAANTPAVADAAGAEAVRDHVRQEASRADVTVQPQADGDYRVQWALPQPTPKISLIIPTRDRVELLEPCVRSILERTTWPDYEIVIIDNGSTEARTRTYLADIARHARVRILDYNRPFNYPAINNFAVRGCEGELVCLLNNDVEVITPDWLQEMAGYALQEGVGAVGAMLYYPDDTIQHAGVILGMHGVADHRYTARPRGFRGQGNRGRRVQNLSAVTGACLMVRRSVYEQVGGLNERLTVAFNDVDFCLRLRARGYRNVWTPWAELYHHESASRGRDESPQRKARYDAEIAYMREHWPGMIEADPAWNRNLSLADPDDRLAFPPREAVPMADRRLAPAARPAPAVPASGRS